MRFGPRILRFASFLLMPALSPFAAENTENGAGENVQVAIDGALRLVAPPRPSINESTKYYVAISEVTPMSGGGHHVTIESLGAPRT
jgi:hypothetical protein